MVKAQELWNSTIEQRKSTIDDLCNGLEIPEDIAEDLRAASKYSTVINQFIRDYIFLKISSIGMTNSCIPQTFLSQKIDAEINAFYPVALNAIEKAFPLSEKLQVAPKNIYELSGANKLAFSNNVTRTLSTTMGCLWEKIANLSPFAINPELEFKIKIKGIDLIFYDQELDGIFYAQLKTQQNTLTGSQKNRSVSELLLHENSIFCACFETASSWTFNHSEIPRISGSAFWNRIGIDYLMLLEKIKDMILKLENDYVGFLVSD